MSNYKNIKLNPLPERELEIIGVITSEKMAVMREKALAKIKNDFEASGFRKGNVPEAIIIQKVGEMGLLEEAAEIALSEEYPKILEEHNIDAIGRPEINITKIATGNDLEFKIKTALLPEVKLADYKKLAKEHFSPTRSVGQEVEAKATTDKKRTEILEAIMEDSTIDLPKIIIEGEMEKMLAQFKDDIAKSGVSYEDYLKHIHPVRGREDPQRTSASNGIKKTEEDLKKEWKDTAVKRAKSQVILNTIAKDEGIAPKEEEVKKEMENILEHYKSADRFRVRMYVETFLMNELVFQFLENQK